MIVLGLVLVQSFFAWSHRRAASGKTPSPGAAGDREPAGAGGGASDVDDRRARYCTDFPDAALHRNRSRRIELSDCDLPHSVSVLGLRRCGADRALVRRWSPRQIARYAFFIVAIGFVGLGIKFQNEWSSLVVILFLIVIGIGQGALVTLLFNVLVTASPKRFAGDVGSLRGTTSNLAAAVGTAVAGALMVSILSLNIERSLIDHPTLPPKLINKLDLNNVNFMSNDQLIEAISHTPATPGQVREAVRINADARLRALRLSLFFSAGLAFLVIIPAGGLPNYVLGQVPSGHPEVTEVRGKK